MGYSGSLELVEGGNGKGRHPHIGACWGQAEGTSQGPIPHHSNSTGHPVSSKCFTIVDWEAHGVTRNTKEAMYICVNDQSLNRNLEKYQLPYI